MPTSCYATPEELAEMRARAARGEAAAALSTGAGATATRPKRPAGAPYVVRLKTPERGRDDDRGPRCRAASRSRIAEIDDFILLRADGTPTYMLAVVVDDHDMGVTHIIRGDDHLNNAFRQLPIIHAMNASSGWHEPVYAHIPLIHGTDGAKLSKRHGALGVDAYRDELGILPEALFNYLLRLGWGHGDQEEFTRDEAIELFDLAGVGKSPSRFDIKKLLT